MQNLKLSFAQVSDMHYKSLLFSFGLAAFGFAPIAEAASPCDWDATRKRNRLEKICYHALGPVSGIWSMEPAHQEKLERCSMHTNTTHLIERAQCADKAKQAAKLEKQQ